MNNDMAVAVLAAALVTTRREVSQAGMVRALRDARAALAEASLAEEEERVSFWDRSEVFVDLATQ